MSIYDDMDDLKELLQEHDKLNNTDHYVIFGRIENSHANLERENEQLQKLASPVISLMNILRESVPR